MYPSPYGGGYGFGYGDPFGYNYGDGGMPTSGGGNYGDPYVNAAVDVIGLILGALLPQDQSGGAPPPPVDPSPYTVTNYWLPTALLIGGGGYLISRVIR